MKQEDATMRAMNHDIRRAIRVELAKRDLKQTDLAHLIRVTPQYMSDMMRGRVGRIPDAWQRAFDALDLQLVAIPKEE